MHQNRGSAGGAQAPNELAACNTFVLTDAQAAELRRQNSQFPFRFQNSPRSVSAMLSLPLFDGFAREQRVQEAQGLERRCAIQRPRSRARDSRRCDSSLSDSQDRSADLRTSGAELGEAKLELKFTQDRYSGGQATFVDLVESRAAYERAESDRINAIMITTRRSQRSRVLSAVHSDKGKTQCQSARSGD
jgi:outer membrane protein